MGWNSFFQLIRTPTYVFCICPVRITLIPSKRVPHAYTTPSSPDAARCWVPCVDNLWEKCTWEFEFVVPRYLEERESRDRDGDEDEVADAIPTLVICSGELVEQVKYLFDL